MFALLFVVFPPDLSRAESNKTGIKESKVFATDG
jgi:hypothetical protein